MGKRGKQNRTRRVAGAAAGALPQERPGSPRRRAALYWALAVGLSAAIVYANAPGNAFVLDDTRLIRDNLRIRSLANVPHLLTSPYWDVSGAQALYRPLVLVTYALDYAVHGLSTYGYSIFNIALHVGVSLLLFRLVRGMRGSLFAAGVAGTLFAVHPVHTEAVTGMSGRPELLAAVFFLLAMHFHRLAPRAGHRSVRCRAAVLACFACALLSKESAITLVLVLPVMDVLVPSPRSDGQPAGPRSRVFTDYLPLACVALVYLAIRHVVLGGLAIDATAIAPLDNPLVPVTTLPLGERIGATTGQAIMTAFAVVVQYGRLLVWPSRLSPDYSYNQIPIVTSGLDPRFLAGVAIAAACVLGIAGLRRRSPIAAFGLAFLALTFSIVSNFAITTGTICAERLMYLPSAGALIAAAVAAERLAGMTSARRRVVYGLVAVLMVMGAVRTWTRNRDWRDESALWSAAVETSPRSARVQSEYARILLARAEDAAGAGRAADAEALYGEARAHFETAVAIYPSYSLALDGLAMIHSLRGNTDEAVPLYDRALKAWPGNYASLTNWGSAVWEQARRTGARATLLRKEGRIEESDALVREADAGFREALEKIDKAIAMMPSYAHAHLMKALILESYVGDRAGAIAEFEEVLRLMPNHPQRPQIESELQRLRAQP